MNTKEGIIMMYILSVCAAVVFVSMVVTLCNTPANKVNRRIRHHRRHTLDFTRKEKGFLA